MEDQVPPETLAQVQAEMDRRRERFKRAVTEAQPAPEDLHRTLLLNLTTRPRTNYTELALSWMQRDPAAWAGYHPEECENAARLTGLGEDV
jgi:DnaJ-domain-containing protein 1